MEVGVIMNAMDAPMLMTVEHAAMVADVSVNTIWRAIREGKLPSYKRGPRDTRFLRSDVETFIQSRSRSRRTPVMG